MTLYEKRANCLFDLPHQYVRLVRKDVILELLVSTINYFVLLLEVLGVELPNVSNNVQLRHHS